MMQQIPVKGTHAHSHIRTQKDAAKYPHARARTCANTMAKDRWVPALMYGVTARWSAQCPRVVNRTDDTSDTHLTGRVTWLARFHTQKMTERYDS